jgi:hypothetical protein
MQHTHKHTCTHKHTHTCTHARTYARTHARTQAFPADGLVHPLMPDAAARARRWGELLRAAATPAAGAAAAAAAGTAGAAAGGEIPVPGAPPLVDPAGAFYVQRVRGLRCLPPAGAAGAAGDGGHAYVLVERGGAGVWVRLPRRSRPLMALVGAFLAAAAGAVAPWLPAAPREALLRRCGLWEAFERGLAAPAASA